MLTAFGQVGYDRQERCAMPLRLLVVEDEALVSIILQDHLNEMGHTVFIAASVATAFAILETERVDGVFLDYNLGGEVSDSIMEWLVVHHVPFAMTTGYGMATLPMAAHKCVAHFIKPYDVQEACKTLVQALSVTATSA